MSDPGWFLGATGDHQTHLGVLESGMVFALCGEVFQPLPRLLGEPFALPGQPPDPDQVCPGCRRRERLAQADTVSPAMSMGPL